TGATGGMGEEWAYQLAHHGFNVIIQGRNRKKLEVVRETIVSRQIYKDTPKRRKSSTTKREETDEVKRTPSSSRKGNAILSKKDVRLTVVINNLGVQSEGYPRLEDLTKEEMAGIVIANSLFPAEVTRKCMTSLKQNQPSLLVTVTSIGAWTPTPYLSPYMGTKGFDVAFSHSLRSEMICEGEQVDVVCMVPGQVQSGMCAEPVSLMVP
ncbi:NAD(P)-binding protein, partial [Meira miltonrushii]